jgi:DNA-binding transcriptional LysR family regulator
MDLEQLRTFVAVVRHGGFTKAASALGLSQSTVSAHVKSLEVEADARLLDRGRKLLRPTREGELVLRHAERAIAAQDGLFAELAAHGEGAGGYVDIVASSVPAEWLLPGAIGELRTSHPGVSVRVAAMDSARAAAAVANDEFDLAFVGSRPHDHRLDVEQIAEDHIVLVAPNPCPFDLPTGPRLLDGVPLVGRTTGSGTYAAIESLLAQHGPANERPYVVEVSSTQAAKACVLEGIGLGFLSRRAVEAELQSDTLRAIELEGLPFVRPLYVASRRGAARSAAAQAIVEAVRRQ